MRALRILLLLPLLLFAAPPSSLEASEACNECHEPGSLGDGNRSVHSPFSDGDCSECHLDHGDEERLMLVQEGNTLCEQCHDREEESFLRLHGGIRGDGASCLSCHDPHRSSLTSLLRPGRHRPLAYGRCDPCHRFDGRLHSTRIKDLCFECHDREEYSRKYGHPPSVEGECLACHDPHGSRQRALLLASYTDRRWTSPGGEDYALCLECHEAEAFTAAGGEETTSFRSGDLNIHKVHVEGLGQSGKAAANRGLTCRNCHEVHSSTYPGLIRSSLDCGGAPCLKLEFRSFPGGGTCSVSCHGTKSYLHSGEELEPAPPSPPPPAADTSSSPAEKTSFSEPTPLEKSINRRCRSCHSDDVQGFARTYVHLPVRRGNCSACHLDHGPDNKLVLLDRQDRLCARCHDLKDLRSAHGGYPLGKATCGECHDPHASSRPYLLYPLEHEPFAERDCGSCHKEPAQGWAIGKEINRVCGECHEKPSSYAFSHGAIKGKGCTGCHRPHAARIEKFLRAEVPDLCLRCHQKRRFTRQTVHPPVEEGDCGACHRPHGSDTAALLSLPYPRQQYLSYSEEAYRLCWECHDADSLTDPASQETGFRDGQESLHALHIVNRTIETELGERTTRGVTCRNCHDPHSSNGPRLVLEELDCGGVPCLQLEFHKIGEGGKCLGGCHTRQSYLPSQ
jgi:predicted CXXCH cytochrome family protein